MYKLKTENFLLELRPKVYQNDLMYSVNTDLNIKVSSYGFSAESVMDIGLLQLINFAIQLNELYETLKGSARLEEPYGAHCYVEFSACTKGHIRVKGYIHNGAAYGYEQELCFENKIDQTYLKSFVKELFTNLKFKDIGNTKANWE